MKTAIHWFRRDLRLTDNTALNGAADAAEIVVPVFILSQWRGQHHWTGPNRQEFLCACLQSLAKNLEAVGGRLIIREGPTERALEQLVADTGAQAIFYNRDPDPFGRAVEVKIETLAKRLGITVSSPSGHGAARGRRPALGFPASPTAFTRRISRRGRKNPRLPPVPRVKHLSVPAELSSLPLPTLAHWKLKSEGTRLIEAGERAARHRLHEFMKRARRGGELRGRPHETDRTDHLAFFARPALGTSVRARGVPLRSHAGRRTRHPGTRERGKIHRRDRVAGFLYSRFCTISPSCSTTISARRRAVYPGGKREDHAEAFERWCTGTTGFPIVDAGMRQLSALGFMHNRLRMITAMFLTKDLRIYWRDGEAFFMRKLADGEIASNNGGWQWSRGHRGRTPRRISASRIRGRKASVSIRRAITSGSGCRSCATCLPAVSMCR